MIRLLLALTLTGAACAQEGITIDHITAAVAAVETATTWKSPGRVSGRYGRGQAGEVSPWQITAMVLRDLRRSPYRAERDVAYAEAAFREWYATLYAKTGSHRAALAAYNGGLRGRNRRDPQAYAERALNLAHRLASEQQ